MSFIFSFTFVKHYFYFHFSSFFTPPWCRNLITFDVAEWPFDFAGIFFQNQCALLPDDWVLLRNRASQVDPWRRWATLLCGQIQVDLVEV